MNTRKPHNVLAKKAFIPPMIRKVLIASAIHSLMITGASATTLDEFVSLNNGKCLDFDKIWGCQCVDLFHQYLQDVFDIPKVNQGSLGGNAYPIYRNIVNKGGAITLTSKSGKKVTFSAIENTSTAVPRRGDIIFGNKYKDSTTGEIYGHVAIVLDANLKTFTSFDQNTKGDLNYGSPATVVSHNYTDIGVVGWLRANPPTVNLNAPADGLAYNVSTSNVTLSWATSSDATTSRVVVSTDQNFSGYSEDTKTCVNPTTCTTWAGASNSYNFTGAKPGQTYYWKVRSNNGDFNLLSDWTAPRKFSITYAAGSSVTPEAKADGILNCVEKLLPQYFPANKGTPQISSSTRARYYSSTNSKQAVFNNSWYYQINGGRTYIWGSIDKLNSSQCHLNWQQQLTNVKNLSIPRSSGVYFC